MTRTTTNGLLTPVAVLMVTLALFAIGIPNAGAAKPEPLANASADLNQDCSVDVAFTLATRGRPVQAIAVHYRQSGTVNGTPYAFTQLSRGQSVGATLGFVAGDPTMGDIYEVTYVAFAKNGHILAQDTLAWYDTSDC